MMKAAPDSQVTIASATPKKPNCCWFWLSVVGIHSEEVRVHMERGTATAVAGPSPQSGRRCRPDWTGRSIGPGP
jgi:hypothetical protein